MAPRLFHFSDDPDIQVFEPRPVVVPSDRQPGQEWLNGPLVWTVDADHETVYLFPRDCPRILLWPTPRTTGMDRAAWWGARTCSMIAHVEWSWLARLASETIYRYELPPESFKPIQDDGWMWVSRQPVAPIEMVPITDLLGALADRAVELRVMDSLVALKGVWNTTLHASGIRLRNAEGW